MLFYSILYIHLVDIMVNKMNIKEMIEHTWPNEDADQQYQISLDIMSELNCGYDVIEELVKLCGPIANMNDISLFKLCIIFARIYNMAVDLDILNDKTAIILCIKYFLTLIARS